MNKQTYILNDVPIALEELVLITGECVSQSGGDANSQSRSSLPECSPIQDKLGSKRDISQKCSLSEFYNAQKKMLTDN